MQCCFTACKRAFFEPVRLQQLFGSLSSVYDPDFLSKWVRELQPLVQAFGQHLFLLLSEPRASYHGCPALLSAPTSILLILVVCSKNRFVEAKTNAEKNQSCVSLHQSRKQPAIVGAASTVLTFPMKGFIIIYSQCLEIML